MFKLARQVLEKLKTYLNEEEVKNVVQYRKKDITEFIKPQLMEHFRKEVVKYEVPDVRGLTPIVRWNITKYEQDEVFDYRTTIEPTNRIRTLLFTGFKKACHNEYTFDSKTEKDFSIILEDDDEVIKWLRPAPGQFNITWDNNKRNYEPDFVVETTDTIYLVETKKEKDIPTEEVHQKANAAYEYCRNASEFTTKNNGKQWKYLLLPHNSVSINNDFNYYVKQYEYQCDIQDNKK